MTTGKINQAQRTGAVLYTRVSTGDQDKNGTSPETQLDACRKKALALGLPIIAEHHDGGVSGGYLLSRPGMQAALAEILTGRADTLICANISRYSRDVEHQQAIKKAVKSAGGRLVFCDMDFDDTPEGDLAFGIMGGFAQYEKAVIKDRTMKGKRKRAEEGQQPQRSTPAYGYHIVTNAQVECGLYPPEMRGRYLVIEEEAEIVRELFTTYAEGTGGFAPLAQRLNARRIPAARGGVWHPVCVSIILRNPVYKGQPAYGRTARTLGEAGPDDRNSYTGAPLIRPRAIETPGKQPVPLTAPPLVSEELWDIVQSRLSENKARIVGSPKLARMLTGRIFCPCGHRAAIVGCRKGKAYQCAAECKHRQLHGASLCQNATYSLPRTEKSVIQSLLEAATHPEVIAAAARAYTEQQGHPSAGADTLRRDRTQLDTALAQIKQQEAAAVQAQIAGIQAGASPDAYAAVFADLAARRKDLENQRGAITRKLGQNPDKKTGAEGRGTQSPKPSTPARDAALAQTALADTARVLASEAIEGRDKRDLLARLIDRVVCQPGGSDIYYLPGVFPGASAIASSTLTELIQ